MKIEKIWSVMPRHQKQNIDCVHENGKLTSMSLWVEFITASGYLSARKIRSRFQVARCFITFETH